MLHPQTQIYVRGMLSGRPTLFRSGRKTCFLTIFTNKNLKKQHYRNLYLAPKGQYMITKPFVTAS